jgi:dihydrofolate reductase
VITSSYLQLLNSLHDNNDNNDNNDNIYSRSTLIKVFSEIETLIAYCNKAQYDCVWIIGGAEIYNLFLDRANTNQDIEISEIHITWIDQDFICDTFFPDIETTNENYQYKMVSESLHNVDASYKVYDRVYHLSK